MPITFLDEEVEAKPSKITYLDDEPAVEPAEIPKPTPSFSLPVSAAQADAADIKADTPQWRKNMVAGASEAVTDLVPRSLGAIAELLSPAASLPRQIKAGVGAIEDIAAGKSLQEVTEQNYPESMRFAEAGKTPPLSKERFKAATGGLLEIAMILGGGKGLARAGKAAPVTEPISGGGNLATPDSTSRSLPIDKAGIPSPEALPGRPVTAEVTRPIEAPEVLEIETLTPQGQVTRQGQAVPDLISVAQSAKTADEFRSIVQKSAIDAQKTGGPDLLQELYKWENATPERSERFKQTGWFGVAAEMWEETKASKSEPVPEVSQAPVEPVLSPKTKEVIASETQEVPQVKSGSESEVKTGTAAPEVQAVGSQEVQVGVGTRTPQEIITPEGEKMRKSAERATTADMIPEPVQETIKTAPESFYEPQSMRSVERRVGAMEEPELAAVPKESDLYTAAKLEQSKRYFDRGENEAGYQVFVELEKEGTRLGQLINQFKFLTSNRPEHVVAVINKGLEKAGKDILNPEQSRRAIETAQKGSQADNALDQTTSEWVKNPTPENAVKAEQALTDANNSALELQRFVSKFQPRTTSGILKSVLQGNLLTPISEVANLVGNVSFLPFRVLGRGTTAAIDMIDATIRNRPREATVSPIQGTVEAVKGIGRGLAKVPEIAVRGTGDTIKGEHRAGLHPVRAWINQFAKTPDMPLMKGKKTLQDRLNLLIEGTIGVPAEAMLRGLGAGDMPFREAARARVIANEAKLAKVPSGQMRMAQKFPELFFDDVAMGRVKSDTLKAIFQGDSSTLNHLTNLIRSRGDMVDLAVATVAPYKLTPWNIVGEILSYNPLVALGRATYEGAKGNSRVAKVNAGKFVVGSMLTGASWWLYKKELVAPSMDQRDEAQKARVLANEVLPPNHLNLSGLKRALSGENPAFQSGDKTVDVFRAGGLAGAMMYMTANIGRDFERAPEVAQDETWKAILTQSTLEQARFGMNQSFLSGIEGLLTAVKDGNADNYVQSWSNTVTAIPLPNTLTALSRATRENKVETKPDSLVDLGFSKAVKARFGFAGADEYLPLKRGLWGEPLRETPAGRNALIYQFFDVTKGKQVTSDLVPQELYRLWRKTGDTKVIPSIPEKNFTIAGQTYNLTQEQRSRYAELVGGQRRRIADAMVINPNWHALNSEQKIKVLDKGYQRGAEVGKVLFWQEAQNNLEQKSKRAGFDAQP